LCPSFFCSGSWIACRAAIQLYSYTLFPSVAPLFFLFFFSFGLGRGPEFGRGPSSTLFSLFSSLLLYSLLSLFYSCTLLLSLFLSSLLILGQAPRVQKSGMSDFVQQHLIRRASPRRCAWHSLFLHRGGSRPKNRGGEGRTVLYVRVLSRVEISRFFRFPPTTSHSTRNPLAMPSTVHSRSSLYWYCSG
jgi:hypothetical protein